MLHMLLIKYYVGLAMQAKERINCKRLKTNTMYLEITINSEGATIKEISQEKYVNIDPENIQALCRESGSCIVQLKVDEFSVTTDEEFDLYYDGNKPKGTIMFLSI
jgi:hypothetical protein